MSIVYQCAGCQKRFKVADTSAGKRVKCKECGAIGTVPAAAAGAPAMAGVTGVSRASVPPPPPAPRSAAAAAPPPPPPPPPKRADGDDNDIFSTMADLERTGQSSDDDAYNMTSPPPPPAGAVGGTNYVPPVPFAAPRHVATVAQPWVPKYLSFLDINKPFHRIALMGAFAVLVVGGLALAAFAFILSQKHAHFNAVAKQTDAKLVGRAVRHDIKRRRQLAREAYDVKYEFTIDGKKYTGKESQIEVGEDFPSNADPHLSFDGQPDARLPIYYDPENPAENRVTQPSTPFDWILIALGVVAMPVGGFGGWRVWRYDRYARSIGS
jgi:hypothetical protein